jgi:hypothetical protein
MTNEEMKAALKEELDAFKNTLGFITADEMKTQMSALEDKLKMLDMKTEFAELKTSVEKQGLEMLKLKTPQGEKTTIKEILVKEHPAILQKITDGGSHKFTVNKTTIGLSSITSDPVGMFLSDWAVIQSQKNAIAPSLNKFVLTADDHGVIYWTDMTTRTSGAAARSDGSAAGEAVYAWTGYSETVDNISAMVPVHREALKHISQLENEIKMLLTDDIRVALDGYCYTGTGTAPQIGGIYTRSTAFDVAVFIAAGGFQPKDANLRDLILSMAAQIMKASKYNVDKVWLNPYDALQLKSYKSDLGIYLPLMVNGKIETIEVIEANSVTANTLVLGDSTKARLYDTGNVEIEVGYNLTGDFSKRILTVLANMECSLLIRNAEVDAFLKCTDITTAIQTLTVGA